MPGIIGLLTKRPAAWANQQLQTMTSALLHEPFYTTGTWTDESLGVYAGWVALANSFSDQMPLRNEKGDRVLFFAGEEYSSPSLIADLRERGHAIDDRPAAYLAHVAEEEGKFPSSLNGRFHGLLVDRTAATAALFNDRYGMQRLYVHEGTDAFYFAPEAKAILAVVPELRTIDSRSLGEFISCGCVLENRTLFRGIGVLPQGSYWKFRNAAVEEKGRYFDPSEWENQEGLPAETYYEELRAIFSRNIPKYFDGHQPVSVSLTGGLDSRMIMAWLRAPANSIPCFSFGGSYRECQDVKVARKVAHICGQPHQTIQVGSDFLSKFPRYCERSIYLTDSCVEANRTSDLYINEIARGIAPVRITGNYGSEVLRSHRAFKPTALKADMFDSELTDQIGHAKETYAASARIHPLSFAVFRQAPWNQYGLQTLEQTQLTMRSPYLDNDLVRTVFRGPIAALHSSDLAVQLVRDGNPELARLRTDLGYGGSWGKTTSALRRRWLLTSFKAEYAYDYGMPQWAAPLDRALRPLHPERIFLGRHKFYHFRVWYRDQLADYVREILLDSRTLSRGWLRSQSVTSIVEGHLSGRHNYTLEIHKLLTLEHLHRLFIDPR
jgi:asparagine synthase (glutamine-hydrolysing)